MRKLFLFLLLVFSLNLASQTSNRRVVDALGYISQGYVNYGFEKLKSAAATNDVAAQFYMAVCYSNGIVVEKDDVEAFKYYRRTAERGLPDGMYYLSICYQKGLGVNADNNRSNEWLQRFRNKGEKLTLPDITQIYNEGLKYRDNYALAPNGNTDIDAKTLAQNNSEIKISAVPQPVSTSSISKPMEETLADVNNAPDVNVSKVSDVDVNIPQTQQSNEKTFVVIISNENYIRLSRVDYSLADGTLFGSYCQNALGIPQNNIRLYKDATYGVMLEAMDDIKNIAQAYKGEIDVIFYYSGHGAPEEQTQESYLLPVDAYGVRKETCYSLNQLYKDLQSLGVERVTIFLDACFSGSSRDGNMLASARGVAIKAKKEIPQGNMVVFSAASDDETALPYKEKGHGLFTYYLLKKLQEAKGKVSLGELGDYIKQHVKQQSVVVNRKLQCPTVVSSLPDWEQLKLK